MNRPAVGRSSVRLLILLATYNERETLPPLVAKLRAVLPDADVLVIDDDSPDGTGQWCESNAAIDPQFYWIHRRGKRGLGAAVSAGLEWSRDRAYDWIGTLDADGSHDPIAFRSMIDAIQWEPHPDVVIGSRYVPGGRIDGWPWHRRWTSRLVNAFARVWLRLPSRDNSGSFRLYRANSLNRAGVLPLRSSGFAYLEEALFRLHRGGSRFIEVPITFRERHRGTSKLTAAEAFRAARELLAIPFQGREK